MGRFRLDSLADGRLVRDAVGAADEAVGRAARQLAYAIAHGAASDPRVGVVGIIAVAEGVARLSDRADMLSIALAAVEVELSNDVQRRFRAGIGATSGEPAGGRDVPSSGELREKVMKLVQAAIPLTIDATALRQALPREYGDPHGLDDDYREGESS